MLVNRLKVAAMTGALVFAPLHAQVPLHPADQMETDRQDLQISPSCTSAEPDNITICARRDQSETYRIDPSMLAAERARNSNPAPDPSKALKPEKCPPHGLRCSGQGAIPVSAIALLAAKTAILSAAGEDWQKSLGLRDEAYDEYRAAKAREARRRDERRVGFGVFSGSKK